MDSLEELAKKEYLNETELKDLKKTLADETFYSTKYLTKTNSLIYRLFISDVISNDEYTFHTSMLALGNLVIKEYQAKPDFDKSQLFESEFMEQVMSISLNLIGKLENKTFNEAFVKYATIVKKVDEYSILYQNKRLN